MKNSLDNFTEPPYEQIATFPLSEVNHRVLYLYFSKPLRGAKGYAAMVWRQRFSVQTDQVGSAAQVLVQNRVEYASRFEDVRLSPNAHLVSPTAVTAGETHRIAEFQTAFEDTRDKHPFDPAELDPNQMALVEIHAVDSDLKEFADFLIFGLAAIFGASVSSLVELGIHASKEKSSR